jgi:hypothetical protein
VRVLFAFSFSHPWGGGGQWGGRESGIGNGGRGMGGQDCGAGTSYTGIFFADGHVCVVRKKVLFLEQKRGGRG